jgi:hypothetical protein
MESYGIQLINVNIMNKRTIVKLIFWTTFVFVGIFAGVVVNWFKLSTTTPFTETDKNVYLRDVDSLFVSSYGLKYDSKYTYFIRGDVETKIFRGDYFLSKRVENDTVNVVLDKKIKKKSLKKID